MKSIPFFAAVHARTSISIGVSVLMHALTLFWVMVHPSTRDEGPGETVQMPLIAYLIPQPSPPKVAASSAAMPKITPQPKKAWHQKVLPQSGKILVQKKADPIRPNSLALSQSPLPARETPNNTAMPTDMMSMIDAARERRRAAGTATETVDINNESAKPGVNDVAIANIAHSLHMQSRGRNGIGGIFQITYKGVRNAQFLFRGWDTDKGDNLRQLVEVDAGPNGDVEIAIVRKMIDLIRKHQPGDFNWNSRRLGRVIVLSARAEDSAQLEKFLENEFFDAFP